MHALHTLAKLQPALSPVKHHFTPAPPSNHTGLWEGATRGVDSCHSELPGSESSVLLSRPFWASGMLLTLSESPSLNKHTTALYSQSPSCLCLYSRCLEFTGKMTPPSSDGFSPLQLLCYSPPPSVDEVSLLLLNKVLTFHLILDPSFCKCHLPSRYRQCVLSSRTIFISTVILMLMTFRRGREGGRRIYR
jgi:hypothetical protein